MALNEKLSRENLYILEIMRNPLFFGEFVNNIDRLEYEEPFIYTDYQQQMLCDFNPYQSLCCARAVGKCLHKSAKILDTDTGEYLSIKELYKKQFITVPSINSNTFKRVDKKAEISYNGIKPTLHIKLEKGFETKVTTEHPFLTNTGWITAKNLTKGTYIAVPNSLPYFGNNQIDDDDLIYIAHFIAEGTYKSGGISTTEQEVIQDIYRFAIKNNMKVYVDGCTYHFNGTYRLRLLEKYNLRHCHSWDKFIPQDIFKLNKKQLSLFISKLFGDDGWCYYNENSYEVGYATTSEKLAKDLQHLLLRFGVIASLSEKKTNKKLAWSLSIKGYENCKNFSQIGFSIKRKKEQLDKILNLPNNINNTASNNIIPIPNFKNYRIKDKQKNRNITTRPLQYYPTRQKANLVINKDDNFNKFLNADIIWLKVIDDPLITSSDETYSIEVETTHTLVADNIYSHNTESIKTLISWIMTNNLFPLDYIVYTVPGKAHLEPVFTALVRNFRTNSFLKNFISPNSGINNSDYTIRLLNQSQLLCRIAGQTGGGVSVIGLHSPCEFLDEAGYYPWGTWIEFQPTLNTWTPGFKLLVSGVPTGLRENNVLYHADQEDSNFSKHRVSAFQNPRFTEEDEERAITQYGGADSDDYTHLVLGQHGKPTFALFDRGLMEIVHYPVYKINLDGIVLSDTISSYIEKISTLPSIPNKSDRVIFGIDLGYTEPTAILIITVDNYGRLRFHARVKLTKVSYSIQDRLIDYLDSKFNPSIIGIDEGSAGKAVIQRLQEDNDFAHKNYKKKIIPINFSSWVSLGTDQDGQEIKSKTKPFATSILQDYSNNHKIIYSTVDLELVTELERMTYSKTERGEIIYKTLTDKGGKRGEDHFTSALLCASLAYYLTYESLVPSAPKLTLFKGGWLLG